MPNLKNRTVNSLKWVATNSIVSTVFQFIFGIALARLIDPTQFGLIAMVGIFTGYTTIFIDAGFSDYIVKSKKISSRLLSSIFWVNIFFGISVTILFFILSNKISTYFRVNELNKIIQFIAINFSISSINLVPIALLKKDLKFKDLTKIGLFTLVFSSTIALIFALCNYQVWALIYQSLASVIFSTFYIWKITNWKPQFIFDFSEIRKAWNYSNYLFLIKSLDYWTKNIDYLMIGKYIGASMLGAYKKSYSISRKPISLFNGQILKVLFPALSILQKDTSKLVHYFMLTTGSFALLLFPIVFFLCDSADDLIVFLYGEAWIDMIPLFEILIFVSLIEGLGMAGVILKTLGKTKLLFQFVSITKCISILCIIVSIKYGVVGVCYGLLISSFIHFITFSKVVTTIIEMPILKYYNIFLPYVIFCSIWFLLSKVLYFDFFQEIFKLLLKTFYWFIGYVIFLWIFKPFPYALILKELVNKVKKNE